MSLWPMVLGIYTSTQATVAMHYTGGNNKLVAARANTGCTNLPPAVSGRYIPSTSQPTCWRDMSGDMHIFSHEHLLCPTYIIHY